MESTTIQIINNNNGEKVYRPKLSFKIQFGFGVGHALNDGFSSIWMTYFIVYIQKVRGFLDWEAGFLMLLGQVADAVANLYVGKFSDKDIKASFFTKLGKRKGWNLIGIILQLFSVIIIFSPNWFENHTGQFVYIAALVIIFQFGWAAVQITHLALIPEITPSESERTKLGATRQFTSQFMYVLVYAVSWLSFGITDETSEISSNSALSFTYIVLFVSVIGCLCSGIFFFTVKENDCVQNVEERQAISVREIFTKLKCWQTLGVYMFTMLFVNLCQQLITPYLSYTLDMSAKTVPVILLTTYGSSVLTSFILSFMKQDWERKKTFIFGTVFGLSAILWISIRSNSSDFIKYEIYFAVALIGVAVAVLTITILGLTADLIANQTDSSATIYSIMTIGDKLINGVAIFIIQIMHEYYNSPSYYKDVIVYVCGGALALACIIVLTIKEKTSRKEGYITLE